jgi:hypothetical protein
MIGIYTQVSLLHSHLVNRDMQKRGWVEYDVDFGEYMAPLAKAVEAPQ